MTTAHRSQNQAPQPFNPNFNTPQPNKDRWLTPKKAIAMGGAAIALGSFFVHKSMNDSMNERLNEITNPDSYSSAPVTPGKIDTEPISNTAEADPAEMTAEAFASQLTRVQQMDYAGTALNESINQDSIDEFNDELQRLDWDEYNYFNRPLVQPSIDNTPQQIQDQITLADYQVWKMAQEGKIEEAKKLATAIAEGTEYDDLVETFANGGAPFVSIGAATPESQKPVIYSGQYHGVESNGLGLTEFTRTDVRSGSTVTFVVRFTQGQNENSGRWVLVKII